MKAQKMTWEPNGMGGYVLRGAPEGVTAGLILTKFGFEITIMGKELAACPSKSETAKKIAIGALRRHLQKALAAVTEMEGTVA